MRQKNKNKTLMDYNRYVYANDTSIFCQHKDVIERKTILNKEFANVYDWFVLIINYQFILVDIKQNAFFSVGIRT